MTIGTMFSNGSLDPAKGNAGTDNLYLDPLYAPLFELGANGKLKGVLAKSGSYVGSGNTQFRITLRRGARFSNGQPLNSAAVVASIERMEHGSGGAAGWLHTCPILKSMGKYEVDIKCTQPDPDLPLILSGDLLGGDIEAASSTATSPIGAGEYTLDSAATVIGSRYTYVANPRYFDQKAIHWQKIVVNYLANPSSGITSVQSGQEQASMSAVASVLKAASGAGLKLTVTPTIFLGLELADRDQAQPLANLKVRQALEYAVNRPAIVKALFGQYGAPTDQIAIPSQPTSWDKAINNYYTYNPAKAKKLLAEAGYAHGVTLKVEDTSLDAAVTQAVVADWNAIGVKATISTDSTTSAWISNALAKKYPVLGYGYGGLPMYLESINWFEPISNPYNPFVTNDPAILNLVKSAETAPPAQQNSAWNKVQAAGVKAAWYVGVAVSDAGMIHQSAVNIPPAAGMYQGTNDTYYTPAG